MGRHEVVTDPREAHQSRDTVSQGEKQRRSEKERNGNLGKGKARGQQLDVMREKL